MGVTLDPSRGEFILTHHDIKVVHMHVFFCQLFNRGSTFSFFNFVK